MTEPQAGKLPSTHAYISDDDKNQVAYHGNLGKAHEPQAGCWHCGGVRAFGQILCIPCLDGATKAIVEAGLFGSRVVGGVSYCAHGPDDVSGMHCRMCGLPLGLVKEVGQ